MRERYIPVSEPVLDEREIENAVEAIRDKAISGLFGSYISRFEREFAEFCGCRYGVAVSNGTVALHLALSALDIGDGDEVLVSTYTNMATFFAVIYNGAIPIPIDVEWNTWNIDPGLIEQKITPRTRAIVVVHIFGHPCDMDPIMKIARRHDLHVIEDCAEAHGAQYQGRPVGSIGTMGCFSFYANKIITTGEGGMITTNEEAIARRSASLKSLAFGPVDRFMHTETGYNYRLTNLQAAIGCAQMSKIEALIEGKRRVAMFYAERLKHLETLLLPIEKIYAKNVYWMYHVVLTDQARKNRDQIMQELRERGIETRPGFTPYNMQRHYVQKGMTSVDLCPVANNLARNAFYLPSTPTLSQSDVDYISENLIDVLEQ